MATAPLPPHTDECLFGGFLRGQNIELVKCRSIDQEVPAGAEIVIEGYIDPAEPWETEGPFGDHTGFYTPVEPFPYVRVEAMTMRSKPIYQSIIVGRPPQEDGPIGKATERRPPFPTVVRDVIWLVMRIDPLKIAPFVPAGLAVSLDLIGVLGLCEATSGSAITPFVRAFGGVAIEGYDSPNTKEAVYIVGDVVTPGAADVMRQFYVQSAQVGEPRVWREDGLLRGSVSTEGKEWLRVTVRPSGRARTGVTGLDAYLGTTERGLNRHIVSYLGAVAPAEVVSFELSEDAPPRAPARPQWPGSARRSSRSTSARVRGRSRPGRG
jgi:hypothetical protein